MKTYNIIAFSFMVVFFSCQQEKKGDSSQLKLTELIEKYQNHEGYDKKVYPLGLFTKSHFTAQFNFASNLKEHLKQIDPSDLGPTDQISFELLNFKLQEEMDFFTFERYLNPLQSDAGFHLDLPYEVQPISNLEQATEYLNKLGSIPTFVTQHITLLREGLSKGLSQPRVIFKGYESTYDSHIVNTPEESYFYTPFENLPATLVDVTKDSITNIAKQVIRDSVIPQFKVIKKFFEEEYVPSTRSKIGISTLPNGNTLYQNRINFYTTSSQYTAEGIHQIGLDEVARIRSEMEEIIESVDFKGDFNSFLDFLRTDDQFYAKTPKELLMRARDMAKRADEQLPKFFKTLPRKPYGVAPVPDAIAPKYTGGRYVGTDKDSDKPGYYWVNTHNLPSRPLYTLPALTVHEAAPGHHLQIALNNELGDSIPQFRKDLFLSAYGEGWALYTEHLGEEMGMYTTPYEHFGKLTYEMWRACRLVVDTGIHAKGWSRDQVIGFMAANTALSLHEIQTETDRYIAWPGQAISYKIGELKIRELRKKAELELGEDFDIREFHEIILEHGTITLPILEDRIKNYITIRKVLD